MIFKKNNCNSKIEKEIEYIIKQLEKIEIEFKFKKIKLKLRLDILIDIEDKTQTK